MTRNEAIQELHRLLGGYLEDVLKYGMPREVYRLITGTGVIQESFKELLDNISVNYVINSSNLGEIILL